MLKIVKVDNKLVTFADLADDSFFINEEGRVSQKNSNVNDGCAYNGIYWDVYGGLVFKIYSATEIVLPIKAELRWTQ